MKKVLFREKISKQNIAAEVLVAESFLERLKGLMFEAPLASDQGMLITRCNSIHTMFMRFSLDVLFLNSEGKIIKIIKAIPPWRITWFYLKASKVLELPAGACPEFLREGDYVEEICLK